MLEVLGVMAVFLFKAVVIVIALIVILSFITSLAMKQKLNENKYKLTNLSKSFKKTSQSLGTVIDESMLAPKAAKKKAKNLKKEDKKKNPFLKERKLFVLDFNGDLKASAGESLKKTVTQVLSLADPKKDAVLVRLESPGGLVSGYGLAASELSRIREADLRLVVSVDKVAASGGYLMSCVANHILAAPFAIVGSIGVVAQMPNFNKLLKKNDIDYEVLTAGKFKRTLTLFGENTPEAREKFVDQLEQIHSLFKRFVSKYRPSLDIEKVATGEYWFGEDALELNLVDEIKTSEDYILELNKTHEVFHLEYKEKEKLSEKLMSAASLVTQKLTAPYSNIH